MSAVTVSSIGLEQENILFPEIHPFEACRNLILKVNQLSVEEIRKYAQLLDAFFQYHHLSVEKSDQFCAEICEKRNTGVAITPLEIIGSKFFQSMQYNSEERHLLHHEIARYVSPINLMDFNDKDNAYEQLPIPEKNVINYWMAGFVEQTLQHEILKFLINQGKQIECRQRLQQLECRLKKAAVEHQLDCSIVIQMLEQVVGFAKESPENQSYFPLIADCLVQTPGKEFEDGKFAKKMRQLKIPIEGSTKIIALVKDLIGGDYSFGKKFVLSFVAEGLNALALEKKIENGFDILKQQIGKMQ